MKNVFITIFFLSFIIAVYPQKIVVGILERMPRTGNTRYDYFYTVSSGSGDEYGLKKAMDNELRQNPQYNWMTDFRYSYVGNEGDFFVVIIKTSQQNPYNSSSALGVGIGKNDNEALEHAKEMLSSKLNVRLINYETVYSKDYSNSMNRPPSKPILIYPTDNSTINSTSVTFEWSSSDPDGDDLNYEISLGEEGRLMSNLAENYKSTTIVKEGLLRGNHYHWRVIVRDGKAEPKWTDGTFYVSLSNQNTSNKSKCPVCNGSGTVLVPESYVKCERCNGTGKIKLNNMSFPMKCEPPIGACYGTGKIKVPAHQEGCTRCNGTGYIDN